MSVLRIILVLLGAGLALPAQVGYQQLRNDTHGVVRVAFSEAMVYQGTIRAFSYSAATPPGGWTDLGGGRLNWARTFVGQEGTVTDKVDLQPGDILMLVAQPCQPVPASEPGLHPRLSMKVLPAAGASDEESKSARGLWIHFFAFSGRDGQVISVITSDPVTGLGGAVLPYTSQGPTASDPVMRIRESGAGSCCIIL